MLMKDALYTEEQPKNISVVVVTDVRFNAEIDCNNVQELSIDDAVVTFDISKRGSFESIKHLKNIDVVVVTLLVSKNGTVCNA